METWRPVVHDPHYEVSSLGRVRSLDRTIVDRLGRTMRRRGKVLSPGRNPKGYLLVNVSCRSMAVHTLVLEAFHGPRPSDAHECCHLDGCPGNNAAENLRWGTRRENTRHKRLHGTMPLGEAHAGAKLA